MRHIFIITALVAAFTLPAATLQDVRDMISQGDIDEAHAVLDSLAAKLPKNAEVDLLRGRALLTQQRDDDALAVLERAHTKGSNDALLDLSEIALRYYRVDDADRLLASYRNYITKNRKKKLTDESGDLDERISRTRSMLDRVEAIEVIDSINVDADIFFKYYHLSPASGRLLPPDALPETFDPVDPSTIYLTEDGRKMMWGDLDSDNYMILKQADALIGGQWTEAEEVGRHLAPDADATYPFLMPDGVTLYFASNAEGGLGGLDIYISRNNGTRYLDPQNMGMPYNSPYNDYLLAIDEETGLGWWATDRNRLPGMVTVYTFIPSDLRHNVDIDDPMLRERAMLTSIALTQPEGADYSSRLKAAETVARQADATLQAQSTAPVAMPDGTVINRISQLKSPRARDAYERYLTAFKRFETEAADLDGLRARYASGDTSVSRAIIEAERKQQTDRQALQRLAAEVSRAEQNR